MKRLRQVQLKENLQQCTASLKESADSFNDAIEDIYRVLNGLLDISPKKADAGQREAKPVNESQGLLTVKEVADYLRVCERSIYLWVRQKNFPYRKVGNDLRFDSYCGCL